MRVRKAIPACLGFFAIVFSAQADHEPTEEELKEGHSVHGEAFNEGPRQAAYLMGKTGDVHFEITTSKPEAQKFFNQGIGQLHGFWNFEAERSFRQVLMIDPDCGMAYCGMAMANRGNQTRAKGFIDKAVEAKEKGGMTKWEEMWIDMVADYHDGEPKDTKRRKREYVKALEGIIHEFPDHVEPKAFLCGLSYIFRRDVPISSYMAVDALLDQVFEASPNHPAHHYRIHLWDTERPVRALDSSAKLANTARDTAHMWHMPGHIYSRLGRNGDAAWHQEAASRVDHKQMMRNRVMPDQIHNYAHNQEWLIRSLTALGRAEEAATLAREMIEVPRHPKYNMLTKGGSSTGYGRVRLAEVLRTFEKWDELLAVCETHLDRTDLIKEQVRHFHARAIAHFGKEQDDKLVALAAELDEMKKQVEKERDAEVKKEESQEVAKEEKKEGEKKEDEKKPEDETEGEEEKKKTAKEIEKAVADIKKKHNGKISEYDKIKKRIELYRAVIAKDSAKVDEILKKERLSVSDKARVYLRVGNLAKAEEEAKKAADEGKGKRVANLISLVEVLETAGKEKEADEAFKRVFENSAEMDLDLPSLARISEVVKRNGHDPKSDWRKELVLAKDIMPRESLDNLGPSKWEPFPAETWSLPGPGGEMISLSDYQGKPVLVIFYLGFGCLHCVEQLEAFAPKNSGFNELGIEILAVATDSKEEVKEALATYSEGHEKFPFKIVSNPELDVFKKYRAHDDFEGKALHGTYLIDGEGKIRWQDIGYEPFTDIDFLLKECERLLKQ